MNAEDLGRNLIVLGWSFALVSKSGLVCVGDVKEPIIVLSLLVDMSHQSIYINLIRPNNFLPPLSRYLPLTKK